jgi:MFS family permease
MCRLRNNDLIAARDLYYMRAVLEAESEVQKGKNLLWEMVSIPRNRRAMVASGLVMFMQQFCGINVIAYYSSTIFIDAGLGVTNALWASLGTGILNWLFALPAFYTIDTFGRRPLLLITFPLMAICLLITGFAFFIPAKLASGKFNPSRIAVVTLGIYLFEIFYSPGEGPVPFTYSAEAFPLYIRELGMSYATAVTWCFNFVLSMTFPKLLVAFKPQGAFGYYAGWCLIGWVAVFLILPETKGLTLEELDLVFSVPHRKHISYQLASLKYRIKRHILRQNPEPLPPLYALSSKLLQE